MLAALRALPLPDEAPAGEALPPELAPRDPPARTPRDMMQDMMQAALAGMPGVTFIRDTRIG